MQTKKSYLIPAFLLSFVLALTMTSAALTFISPTTNGSTVTGTISFNISSDQNFTNCSWSTSLDANFNSTVNITENQIVFNSTAFDTSALTDAEDTTLSVNCSNGTNSETGKLLLNVDNTDPACVYSLNIGEETIEFMDAYGIYPSDASTDTTDLTYAWTLWDPSKNSQQTSTSATPNFASDDFDEIGDFVLGLTVTDEASKTNACTNLTISVTGTDDDITPSIISTFLKENKTTAYVIGGVIFIILAGVAGYFIIQSSKK